MEERTPVELLGALGVTPGDALYFKAYEHLAPALSYPTSPTGSFGLKRKAENQASNEGANICFILPY